jgi:hypothetical protein
VGVPVECMNEKQISSIVISFGTYLGSLNLEFQGDLITWSAILATNDLTEVPQTISFFVCGLKTVVTVRPGDGSPIQSTQHLTSSPPFLPTSHHLLTHNHIQT